MKIRLSAIDYLDRVWRGSHVSHTLSKHNVLVQVRGQLEALITLLPTVVIESALNVGSVLITMEPDVGHKDVPVVGDEILNDLVGAVLDVHIAPVDPRVLGLQGSGEKIVSCAAHGLSARALGSEAVSVLYALREVDAKVLFDNHGAAEGKVLGLGGLYALQLFGQDGEGVVCGVANQEGEIDQVVGVTEARDQVKVVVDVVCGVAQGSKQEHALVVVTALCRRDDWVEVDLFNGAGVDLDGRMVVEQDWGLVGAPENLLVGSHLHGRLGRAKAVEPT